MERARLSTRSCQCSEDEPDAAQASITLDNGLVLEYGETEKAQWEGRTLRRGGKSSGFSRGGRAQVETRHKYQRLGCISSLARRCIVCHASITHPQMLVCSRMHARSYLELALVPHVILVPSPTRAVGARAESLILVSSFHLSSPTTAEP